VRALSSAHAPSLSVLPLSPLRSHDHSAPLRAIAANCLPTAYPDCAVLRRRLLFLLCPLRRTRFTPSSCHLQSWPLRKATDVRMRYIAHCIIPEAGLSCLIAAVHSGALSLGARLKHDDAILACTTHTQPHSHTRGGGQEGEDTQIVSYRQLASTSFDAYW
jgi:hypothetical protein